MTNPDNHGTRRSPAAPGDPIQRLREFFDVGHTSLAQVSNLVTPGQQLNRVLDLDVRGEQQDPDVRKLLPDRARALRSYEVKEFLGVSGLTGHGKAGALGNATAP